jgi:ABC-type branched-subunit amino acid transport system ATPase component
VEPIVALELADIRLAFEGLRAVDGASLQIHKGRVTGVIGPNGAGKSTLFNIATGFVRPNSGQVVFEGNDITHWQPHARVRGGLGRTFQNPRRLSH